MKTLARLFRRAADRLDPPMKGLTVPTGWTGTLTVDTGAGMCPYCGVYFVGSHACAQPGPVSYSGPLTSASNS